MEGGGRLRMHPDKEDSQWVYCATPCKQGPTEYSRRAWISVYLVCFHTSTCSKQILSVYVASAVSGNEQARFHEKFKTHLKTIHYIHCKYISELIR